MVTVQVLCNSGIMEWWYDGIGPDLSKKTLSRQYICSQCPKCLTYVTNNIYSILILCAIYYKNIYV